MKLQGILIASAALGLLAAAPAAIAADSADGGAVKCQGINGCGGKGECKAVDGSHDCAGKNSCKGKGWVTSKSAEDCKAAGGTVVGTK
jgi:hypothetical protein